MARLLTSRVNGSIHSIDELAALSDEPCNIRFFSDKALYVLNNLASLDVMFTGRYGYFVGEGMYEPVSQDSPDYEIVQNTIYQIQGGMSMTCIDDLITAINSVSNAINSTASGSACCGNVGNDVEQDGEEGGEPPPGYIEPSVVADRKCHAANYLNDRISQAMGALININFDGLLDIGVSALTGITGGGANGGGSGSFLYADVWCGPCRCNPGIGRNIVLC